MVDNVLLLRIGIVDQVVAFGVQAVVICLIERSMKKRNRKKFEFVMGMSYIWSTCR
jgi:hypothetical protein